MEMKRKIALYMAFVLAAMPELYGCQSVFSKNATFNKKIEILEIPLEELDLSVRAYTCLKRSGIDTVGDISHLSEYDLMRLRNLGKKALDEIIQKLNSLGVSLAEEDE